jgi:hypothetical protein
MIFYAGAEGIYNKILYEFCKWKFILISTLDIKPTDQQYDVLLVWKENSE